MPDLTPSARADALRDAARERKRRSLAKLSADERRARWRKWKRAQRRPERAARGLSAKERTRHLVWTALRNGTLRKPRRCDACNRPKPSRQIHAHHHDYRRPLAVSWLCPECHGRTHRKPASQLAPATLNRRAA